MTELAIGEHVFWPNGKVSVMTEDGLRLTEVIDWRVTWAVETQTATRENPDQ